MPENTREFSKMEDAQLQAFVVNDSAAKNLWDNKFFSEVLVPRIQQRASEARAKGDWLKGDNTIEQIAINTIHQSSIAMGIEILEEELTSIEKDGAEARKEIERREEKEKKK